MATTALKRREICRMGINIKKVPKFCNKCKALGSYIYNHYGIYYCWDKEGCFIFEGKDTLPVPTPKWCPKLAQNS